MLRQKICRINHVNWVFVFKLRVALDSFSRNFEAFEPVGCLPIYVETNDCLGKSLLNLDVKIKVFLFREKVLFWKKYNCIILHLQITNVI